MIKRLLTLIAGLLLAAASLTAQDYQVPEIKKSRDIVSVDGRRFYAHVVETRQTLYSISKVYGVTLSEIYDANKNLELAEKGLKVGQVLLIPMEHRQVTVISEEEEQPGGEDYEPALPDTGEADSAEKDGAAPGEEAAAVEIPDVFKVAVILPFSDAKLTNSCVDYYSGMLLAAKDFGNNGFKLDLKVYDLKDTVSLTKEAIRDCEVVFGPFSVQDIKTCMRYCPDDRFIISPIDPKAHQLTKDHNVIHSPTPPFIQNHDVVDWLKGNVRPEDKVVLVVNEGKSSAGVSQIISALRASGLTFSTISYNLVQMNTARQAFSSLVAKNGTTRYLLASEDESFVSDVLRNVSIIANKGFSVEVYANSKLRGFASIESEYLHNSNCHVSAAYFTDYYDPRVSNFIYAYRSTFEAEPNSFAYHGYDTMHYFLHIYRTYGADWQKMISGFTEKGLQTDFVFVKSEEEDKGYVNSAVRRIDYLPDYSIRLVEN